MCAGCVQVPARGQKRVLNPLEPDRLETVVSQPAWVLGVNLGSSAKAAHTLPSMCQASLSVSQIQFK